MRHADIRMTMNAYGDVVTDEMTVTHRKVVGLALKNRQRVSAGFHLPQSAIGFHAGFNVWK